MIELTFNQTNIRQTLSGDYEVGLVIPASQKQAVEQLYNDTAEYYKPMVAKISKKTNKRSLDANSYMWVICDKIAKAIKSTKEDVYRIAIRDVGEWEDKPISDNEVEEHVRKWGKIGEGWFSEVRRDSKVKGYKVVRDYYGSHVYDTVSMARLIDYIVQEAKELGIPTETPEEIERLKKLWE